MAQSLEAKIVVLGSQGVGKTSLVHRYVKNHFQSANMTSTVGASFLTKRVIDDESDTVVRLQIWDTAGQERFRSISRLYYRGANACILCYSITDPISFTEMGIWLLELRRNLPPDIILHVVGTKSDLVARDPSLRQVPFERCIAYVADNLAPGVGSTPPVSAGGSGVGGGGGILERAFTFSAGNASGGAGSMGMGTGVGLDGARSPSSKRSSGFWGQEVGWDCCHEVSAESGEGVEEVFRVITRKLVKQNRILQEGIVSAVQSPGGIIPAENDGDNDGGSGYFSERSTPGRSGGSFRVGRDRRNWFGVPLDGVAAGGVGAVGSGGGDDVATVNVEGMAVDHSRRRCC